jgi:predicted ArsR family transcriptional regulator
MSLEIRSNILDLFVNGKSLCADDILLKLAITKGDVQYHLKQLQSEGMIQKEQNPIEQKKRPGRPRVYFSLTSKAMPDNYQSLCNALLPLISASDAKRLLQLLLVGYIPPIRFPLRLNTAVHFLNQHNYMARWEAHRDAPQITLANCPYEQLRQDFPVLCQIDHQLIAALLALQPSSVTTKFCKQKTFTQCVFYAELESAKI